MIRGSSLPRFSVCNGFLTFDQTSEESEYAKEGTAFHEFLESAFKGNDIKLGMKAKNDVICDADMLHFIDKILPTIPKDAVSEMEVRYKISNTEIVGHLDYNWEEDGGDTLVIMDIKYGYRAVEVENNWQLIGYALGVMIQNQRNYNKIILKVIQPRAHHYLGTIRECSIDSTKAFEYYTELTKLVTDFENGNIQFKTSEYCRYCPALGKGCTAFNQATYNAIDYVTNLKIEDNMNNDQLCNTLNNLDRAKDLLDLARKTFEDLAKSKLKSGETLNGWGIENSYGHRKWSKDVTIESIKAMTGLDLSAPPTLMSPAEAEKNKIDQTIIDSFSYKEQIGFKLTKMNNNKYADKIFGKGK